MLSLKRYFLICLALLLSPCILLAQDITGFSYKLINSKIEVKYTLGGESSERYAVTLYNSIDGYKTPLKLVTGDVGDDITPGKGKTIIWDAKKELGEFKGGISLKLKTRLVPFITFSIAKGEKYKMGNSKKIIWEGTANNLKLELYQNDIKISDIGLVSSGQSYNWELPKKGLSKGSNYKIKGSANGRSAQSEPFEIKKKIPIYIWAVPVVIAGGVIAILSGGDNNNSTESNTIPAPLGPN